ncbi:Hypothetical protein CINCED_3A020743, partial [Cinara cedri]
MLKIIWSDRVTNEKVLRITEEKGKISKIIIKRRDNMIRHPLRHDGLPKLMIEGWQNW